MINNNIRKLRCLIPDHMEAKYPRLLSLFDDHETMTPEYNSMETFMSHFIRDMESQGITAERFSIFNTSRGIAYRFSNGLLLVPVPVYQKSGGTGLFSLHDIGSVFKDVDGCGSICLMQLPGQKKPVMIHTAFSRDTILKRLDCALEAVENRSPVHAGIYFPDVQDMTDRLSTETYGVPLSVHTPAAEISADDIARNLSSKPKAEQARILGNVIQSLGWNALKSDERKEFVQMVMGKTFHDFLTVDTVKDVKKEEAKPEETGRTEFPAHSPKQETLSLPERKDKIFRHLSDDMEENGMMEKAMAAMEEQQGFFDSLWSTLRFECIRNPGENVFVTYELAPKDKLPDGVNRLSFSGEDTASSDEK